MTNVGRIALLIMIVLSLALPVMAFADSAGRQPVGTLIGDAWIETRTLTGAVEFPADTDPRTPFLVLRTDDGRRYWVDLRPLVPHTAGVDAGDRVEAVTYATTRPDVVIAVSVQPAGGPAASPPGTRR